MRKRFLLQGLGLIAATGAVGCAVGTDLVNPGLFSSLGLDPSVLTGAGGTVIVLLENQTDLNAEMSFIWSNQAGDTVGTELVAGNVEANDSINQVLTCPVTLVLPAGANVIGADGSETAVDYAASGLTEVDFDCGDLIRIQLIQAVLDDGTFGFGIRVIVAPGA